MSRVVFNPTLDAEVAERIVRPRIEDAAAMLHDAARRLAPPCKVWVTMRDDLVRTSHHAADAQTVPDNLRFIIPRPGQRDTAAGSELPRAPRDTVLTVANAINCRCESVPSPTPLRTSIKRSQVQILGTRVSAQVYTEFPRAAESEFGTSGDRPAHYMTGALNEVAARLRSGQTR